MCKYAAMSMEQHEQQGEWHHASIDQCSNIERGERLSRRRERDRLRRERETINCKLTMAGT